MSDQAGFRSNAPNAFVEHVYTENAARLRGWLTSICRDEVVAEDLTQEAFVRLLHEAREGRSPDDAVAWLHRVGSNLAMSRGRRIAVADRRAGDLAQPGLVASPEAEAVAAEEAAAVRSAVGELDGDDREAVILAAHGYRGPEIAERIGRSNGATRTLLCRARAKVRQQLLVSGAFQDGTITRESPAGARMMRAPWRGPAAATHSSAARAS